MTPTDVFALGRPAPQSKGAEANRNGTNGEELASKSPDFEQELQKAGKPSGEASQRSGQPAQDAHPIRHEAEAPQNADAAAKAHKVAGHGASVLTETTGLPERQAAPQDGATASPTGLVSATGSGPDKGQLVEEHVKDQDHSALPAGAPRKTATTDGSDPPEMAGSIGGGEPGAAGGGGGAAASRIEPLGKEAAALEPMVETGGETLVKAAGPTEATDAEPRSTSANPDALLAAQPNQVEPAASAQVEAAQQIHPMDAAGRQGTEIRREQPLAADLSYRPRDAADVARTVTTSSAGPQAVQNAQYGATADQAAPGVNQPQPPAPGAASADLAVDHAATTTPGDADLTVAPAAADRTASTATPAQAVAPISAPADLATITPPPAQSLSLAQAALSAEASQQEAMLNLEVAQDPASWRLAMDTTAAAARGADLGNTVQARPQTVAQQLSVAINTAQDGQVELRLDPPELGRVQIQMQTSEDGVRAVVIAERAETQELLRRHADMLSRHLEEAGFTSVSLDFTAGSEAGSGGMQGEDGSSGEGQTLTGTLGDNAAVDPAKGPVQGSGRPDARDSGISSLDIRL
ncbi:MAG: flagellar hook-length control protein FliK [Pseudomonadota bacterium]